MSNNISRFILSVLLPPSSPLLGALSGWLIIRFTKYKKQGRAVISISLITLYALSTPFISNLLIKPLETSSNRDLEGIRADAVVVLTSGIEDLSHLGFKPVPDAQSLKRLVHAVKIKRMLGRTLLVIVGGRADPARPEMSFGRVLYDEAIALGVAEHELLLEDDSQNTEEGAHNLKRILPSAEDIVLVTSASHIKRATMLYEAEGFKAHPSVSDYAQERTVFGLYSFVPAVSDLSVSSLAFYEYLSRLWHNLK